MREPRFIEVIRFENRKKSRLLPFGEDYLSRQHIPWLRSNMKSGEFVAFEIHEVDACGSVIRVIARGSMNDGHIRTQTINKEDIVVNGYK